MDEKVASYLVYLNIKIDHWFVVVVVVRMRVFVRVYKPEQVSESFIVIWRIAVFAILRTYKYYNKPPRHTTESNRVSWSDFTKGGSSN